MATQQGGAEIMADKCPTITASAGMSGNNQPVIVLKTFHIRFSDKVTEPLKARDYKDPLVVLDRAAYNQGENAKYDFEARVGGGVTAGYCERSRGDMLSEHCATMTTSFRSNNR